MERLPYEPPSYLGLLPQEVIDRHVLPAVVSALTQEDAEKAREEADRAADEHAIDLARATLVRYVRWQRNLEPQMNFLQGGYNGHFRRVPDRQVQEREETLLNREAVAAQRLVDAHARVAGYAAGVPSPRSLMVAASIRKPQRLRTRGLIARTVRRKRERVLKK